MEETEPIVIPGLVKDLKYQGKKYEPGSDFNYHTYVSPSAQKWTEQGKKLALYVLLEHTPETMCPMLSDLMDEGLMPPGLILFAYPGIVQPTLPNGEPRGMRTKQFDEFGREYTDLFIEELIPEAAKNAGVKLDPNPDMHFITGGSSGGTMAWNAVWFRTDYFRRTFISSPTFAAERGGDEMLTLVRKTETKPIRIYMTVGEEEPAGVDGSSLYCALSAADTFEYAGYDFRFEQFRGEGHCCRRENAALWRRIVRFVWANWRTDAVKPLTNQVRISLLLEPGTVWEEFNGPMPKAPAVKTPNGTYTFEDGNILLKKGKTSKVVASGFGKITSMQISTDKWRLYFNDLSSRYLFAMSIFPDGSLGHLCKLAPIYLPHDCHQLGANGLTVLPDNRVLAATELGVQGVYCTGMIDLILPLPGDLPADSVAYADGMIYASSGKRVFRRWLRKNTLNPVALYSCRSHLIP